MRRSKHEWLELFKKHAQSGLTATAFCRNENISYRYFSLKKKKLLINTKSTNDFVKVSVPRSNENLSLEFRDVKLSWNRLPPSAWLSDFIRSLK